MTEFRRDLSGPFYRVDLELSRSFVFFASTPSSDACFAPFSRVDVEPFRVCRLARICLLCLSDYVTT